jgi:ketosteroid isomerase-like protein
MEAVALEARMPERDTARAMSQENVDVIRAVIDGWLRGDSSTLNLISEDAVYVAPPGMLGGGTYRGHEGVLEWFVDWRREWTKYEAEVIRFEDLGDRVFTVERNRATGKRSGIAVDMETFSVWTLRDGKVVRWEGYASENEALEAAGLSE